ncbi:MAG: hypothetical protein C0514_07310 [Candidatus Puniceispirillum sp.]|nr:hypothetical protein [Candidatus Puniceispirillum sp.]
MKKYSLLISASLCSTLVMNTFASACEEVPREQGPPSIAQAVQSSRAPTVAMLSAQPGTYALWEEFFQNRNAPSDMSVHALHQGLTVYARENKMEQWIERVRAYGLEGFIRTRTPAFIPWFFLLNNKDVVLKDLPQVSFVEATRILFPGKYLEFFRSVTQRLLFENLVSENAFNRSPGLSENLIISSNIYQVICQAGAQNLQEDQGKDLEGSLSLAYDILSYRQFFDRLPSNAAWDLSILTQVRDQTQGLNARDKAYLDFHIRIGNMSKLTSADQRDVEEKKGYAAMIHEITPFLNPDAEDSFFQSYDFYPFLAKCEAYLGDYNKAFQAWQAYESEKRAPWGQSDLFWAMNAITSTDTKQSTFTKWLDLYKSETDLDLKTFRVKSFEIELVVDLIVSLKNNQLDAEAIDLGERYFRFLNNEGRDLQKSYSQKRYESAYTNLESALACLYVSVGRYKEAANMFRQHFVVQGQTVTLKEDARRLFESVQFSQESLKVMTSAASVAFAQAGLIKATSAAKPVARRGKAPIRGARGGLSARAPMAAPELVRQHLIDHYKQRLLKSTQRLDAMLKTVRTLSDSQALLRELSHKEEVLRRLQSDFNASSIATGSSNLGEIGREIDKLSVSFSDLSKELESAYVAHKREKKRALETYLARVIQEEREETLPFVMAPDSPPQPQASPAKRKKRGAASSSHASSSRAPAVSKTIPLSAQTVFFQKKQAQMDYEGLDKRTRAKANELISEIALNPYSLVGQGRPERLQTSVGIYFSRRLGDGHRMVYEVVKKPGAPTRVVLISFLSHYKNLERHQESTHMTPFARHGAASSSSSAAASSSS